jgi:hypothetical protein
MGEYKEVKFDIQGEFITKLSREWFFCENKGYEKVMELLLCCMEGTDQSEKELHRLVDRGWVLLHSPGQGIAQPTRNPVKRYTKAQQEFLYGYYMERGKGNDANAVYKED